MHYYIDGYNLLFRLLHGRDNPYEGRQLLIEELNAKAHLLNLSLTLVFDSQYREGELAKSHFRHIQVVYSGHGETADQCILDAIALESRPNQVTVVTSDKKLAWFARRCTAKTESVEQFVRWLSKRSVNTLKKKSATKKVLVKKEPLKQVPVEPKKTRKPSLKATAEECFDYYLQQFEASLEKAPIKKKKTPKTRRKKVETKPRQEPISDMERWLRAFERDL